MIDKQDIIDLGWTSHERDVDYKNRWDIYWSNNRDFSLMVFKNEHKGKVKIISLEDEYPQDVFFGKIENKMELSIVMNQTGVK